MKNYAITSGEVDQWIRSAGALTTPSALHLVTVGDLEELRNALMRGALPTDLEIKLRGLAQGSLLHQSVEQNCRLFTSLLLAAEHSSFNEGVAPTSIDCYACLLMSERKMTQFLTLSRMGSSTTSKKCARRLAS